MARILLRLWINKPCLLQRDYGNQDGKLHGLRCQRDRFDRLSQKANPISMKTKQALMAAMIAGGVAWAGQANTDIIYDVNLPLGTGGAGIVGTITTDGSFGEINAYNILAWSLTATGNGGSTFNLVNGPSGVNCGNNSAAFNPTAGTPDLTADAAHIYFNFSATDGGYLGFQTLPLYTGNQYLSFGANVNSDVYQGVTAVPVYYSDPSTINLPESGNQIIASAVPEPSTCALAGLGSVLLLSLSGRRFWK